MRGNKGHLTRTFNRCHLMFSYQYKFLHFPKKMTILEGWPMTLDRCHSMFSYQYTFQHFIVKVKYCNLWWVTSDIKLRNLKGIIGCFPTNTNFSILLEEKKLKYSNFYGWQVTLNDDRCHSVFFYQYKFHIIKNGEVL